MAERLAVILAAGAGTRLRPRSERVPKCLLEIGGLPAQAGRTLLDYQLDALARHGIRDVLVVSGFAAEQITERYGNRVRSVHNPDFETTNNLHSLWTARQEFAGRDFLCLHADVLFHPAVLTGCLESKADACFLLDRELNQETMKARLEGGRVVEISKSIAREQMGGTFLGIARFAPRASSVLPEVLEALVQAPANRNAYFTACVPELSRRGLNLGCSWTNGLPWIEIDFEADFERAERNILPRMTPAQ